MAIAEDHVAGPPVTVERPRWRISWIETIAALVIVVGGLVFLYPHIASWFSQKEQSRVTEIAQERMHQPPNNDPDYRAEVIAKARQYNDALAGGAVFEANANIVIGDGTSTDDTFVYDELLDTTGTGFMGRIQYDALDIDLPIYHGTDNETLLKGVGHLEGTSLPVGGDDARSVLTAHRGLPEATLFNELNKAEVGDTFTVSVLDEVLTYEVVETLVIEPDQTEEILPVAGKDMVTLVTCTPLGVNSHRILVNAERITPTPVDDIETARAAPELPGFPWWAVVLGALLIAATVFIWHAGRPRKSAGQLE